MYNDLVVFCHLRWDFVWQRPQHVVTRLAKYFDRVTVIEEPLVRADVSAPRLSVAESHGVTRVWLDVPGDGGHCGFDDPRAETYMSLIEQHLRPARRTVWLYTPLALPLAEALDPETIVYDVMDDLTKFANASPGLRPAQDRCLAVADTVFTGGRSLQQLVVGQRPDAVCFPSGVEIDHFAAASPLRRTRNVSRRTAGYVGVIDERLDLDLLAELASRLHDWDIRMVGPVVKIDPASLPRRENIHYTGAVSYADLPRTMSELDIALMPFALNEATASISPTKSLEYLAAGLPVVSTRVPDVVAGLGHIVALADDGDGFARACRQLLDRDVVVDDRSWRPVLRWNQWDAIVERMYAQFASATAASSDELAAGS